MCDTCTWCALTQGDGAIFCPCSFECDRARMRLINGTSIVLCTYTKVRIRVDSSDMSADKSHEFIISGTKNNNKKWKFMLFFLPSRTNGCVQYIKNALNRDILRISSL